jgi:hypothetical protein
VLTRLLKLDLAPTLEEVWEMGKRSWGPEDSLAMTEEENVLGTAICKLALNVCLLGTTYGVRCLGPDNPSHHQRLQRYAKVAQKKGPERVEAAEIELLTHPLRYDFAEEVVVFRRQGEEERSEAVGGWTVKPHWRRGHCTPRSSWLERANGLRPGSSIFLYRQEVRRWGVAAGRCSPVVKQLPLKGTGEVRCRPPRRQA